MAVEVGGGNDGAVLDQLIAHACCITVTVAFGNVFINGGIAIIPFGRTGSYNGQPRIRYIINLIVALVIFFFIKAPAFPSFH